VSRNQGQVNLWGWGVVVYCSPLVADLPVT